MIGPASGALVLAVWERVTREDTQILVTIVAVCDVDQRHAARAKNDAKLG
jgi:hypothetical protein